MDVVRVLFLNRLPSSGVAQHRHLVHGLALVLGVDAADDDSATVLDQHLGLGMLGVDRIPLRRQYAAVLVDVHVQDDAPLGGDLRRHLKLEVGLAEGDGRRAASVAT